MTPNQPMPPQGGAPAQQPGGQAQPMSKEQVLAQLPPEDKAIAEKIATGVRAVLASPSGDKVIGVAEQGTEQLATAAVSVVTAIREKLQLTPEDLPIAIMTAVLEIVGFLVQTGAMKPDGNAIRAAMALALAQVVGEIGPPDQSDLDAMNNLFVGLGDELASVLQMQGGGQPPAEQAPPEGAPPQGGGMIPSMGGAQ